MMNAKSVIFLLALIMLLAGCLAKSVPKNSNIIQEPKQAASNYSNNHPSDKELFSKALSYLSNKYNEPNYMEANTNLKQLAEQYPKSRWTPCALALIDVLEKIKGSQSQLVRENERLQADYEKLIRENKYLKDSMKQNDDRYNSEIIKLQQENEKLKNDIKQLKKLEVQMERREKMLR